MKPILNVELQGSIIAAVEYSCKGDPKASKNQNDFQVDVALGDGTGRGIAAA